VKVLYETTQREVTLNLLIDYFYNLEGGPVLVCYSKPGLFPYFEFALEGEEITNLRAILERGPGHND